MDPDFGNLFQGFFFYSFCHGTKSDIGIPLGLTNAQSPEDRRNRLLHIVKNRFYDLDWHQINLENVFVDLGFEFHQPGQAGFWQLRQPSDEYPGIYHRRLLTKLIGRRLQKEDYKMYNFGGLKNAGGFKYVSKNLEAGSGPYHAHKIIAYQPLKEHFVRKDYSRGHARWNLNQTCSPSDVWNMSKRFLNITVSLFDHFDSSTVSNFTD